MRRLQPFACYALFSIIWLSACGAKLNETLSLSIENISTQQPSTPVVPEEAIRSNETPAPSPDSQQATADGTGGGYNGGGDAYEIATRARAQLVAVLEFLSKEPNQTGLIKGFEGTQAEAIKIEALVLASISQVLEINRGPQAATIRIVETLPDSLEGRTLRGKEGDIELLKHAVLTKSEQGVFQLLVHECFHKTLFEGNYLDDDSALMPFNFKGGSRFLIDSAAKVLAMIAFERVGETLLGTSFSSDGRTVLLLENNTSRVGFYLTALKDAGQRVQWRDIQFTPSFPAGKPLPPHQGKEEGFQSGNMDMSQNVTLYFFDETQTGGASDRSGKGLNATCTASSCPQVNFPGRVGSAFQFDAAKKTFLNLPSGAAIVGKGAFALSLWFKSNAKTHNQTLVAQREGNDYDGQYQVVLTPEGRIRFLTWDETYQNGAIDVQSKPSTSGGTVLNNDQWHHLVILRTSSGQGQIFIDGKLDTLTSQTIQISSLRRLSVSIGADLRIRAINPNLNCYFDGLIDEFALFNRELSATEIQSIYLRGATHLKYQFRSCETVACRNRTFVGPDGTDETFFTSSSDESLSLPSFALALLNPGRFLQARIFLEALPFTALTPMIAKESVATHE